jgi:hypothetical protein
LIDIDYDYPEPITGDKTMARPSSYKETYPDLLIQHMRDGFSYESFAGLIGVHLDTLYDWEHKHSLFSEAKKMAFQQCRLWWEKLGKQGALGSKDFNATVWIFNMKNRFGWRDVMEQKIEMKEPEKMSKKEILEELQKIAKEVV